VHGAKLLLVGDSFILCSHPFCLVVCIKTTIHCKKCNSTKLVMDHKYSENICSDCGTIDCILTDELTFKEEQETSEKIISYSYFRYTRSFCSFHRHRRIPGALQITDHITVM
jgi:hypothetical protein